MTDPIAAMSGVVSVAQGLWQFLAYVHVITGTDVIAAYFSWDGTRLEGSEKIVVEKHQDASDAASWWFSVRDELDYVYIRYPVVESCAHELVGQEEGQPNPDAKFWRWVAPVPPGAIADPRRVNLAVNFIVVGYRPKAFLNDRLTTG